MKKQSISYLNNQFLQNRISILPDYNFNYQLLNGSINFFFYDENDVIIQVADIIFSVFNSFEAEIFWSMADSISGDFEFVASTYNSYCTDITETGSIAIIDNFIFSYQLDTLEDKFELINICLETINEVFEVLGIDRIVFMTKALIFNLASENRLKLANDILKIGYIPIYQDQNDIVVAKNLNYV